MTLVKRAQRDGQPCTMSYEDQIAEVSGQLVSIPRISSKCHVDKPLAAVLFYCRLELTGQLSQQGRL